MEQITSLLYELMIDSVCFVLGFFLPPVMRLQIKLLDEHTFLTRELKSSMKYETVLEEMVTNLRYELSYFSIDLASGFILSLFSKLFS